MDFKLSTLDFAQAAKISSDALIVLIAPDTVWSTDPISSLAQQALSDKDLDTTSNTCLNIYKANGIASKRLILVSVSNKSNSQIKKAVSSAIQSIKANKAQKISIVLSGISPLQAGNIEAAVLATAESTYVYTTSKSKQGQAGRSLREVHLAVAKSDFNLATTELSQAKAIVSGVELAKEWGNRPGNYATPSDLATVAKVLGKAKNIQTEVLGPKEVATLGMGSFMAVAQGSAQPLRFIVMHYTGAAKTVAPTVLVGKGITFDSGGISLKPGPEMDEMKFDMCGAASVLGVFKALAESQPKINVVGLIPTCENLPGPNALKPGDVITAMDGQTIEVLNTDAEGRLILCDALVYAQRFNPKAVIDVATLTGACVIALGSVRSGLFTNHDQLASDLSKAGDDSGDLCWRMPLDDEYALGMKSNFADVANIGGRAGGSITAAKFLQRFTAKMPWAHLDIAGSAWKSGAEKGSTGRPVPLLLKYLGNAAQTDYPMPAGESPKTASKVATKLAKKPSLKSTTKAKTGTKTTTAAKKVVAKKSSPAQADQE